ncbi:hypothetical protein PR202_gb18865 [Eleusine coracana subsp. coracana]|uniref:Bifunctional inhibitor/plant lipid transfer protein/seed storage helical domain-containing protein n=1 Tax=Eleusine coracana subsp. coracana TaxID=191504 RepID=A0AAV5F6Q4_ELECO|nr:hypothetical protein PR202_gb18865 [Eleusine coracana subsp. coracana]
MAMARARLLVFSLASLLSAVALVDGLGAPAPAPSVDCTNALVSLAGCLSYVQEGSTVTTPDPTCCSGLKDVVRNEVACLCQAFQGGQDFGVALNMTKALQLPAACNVKTPPFSNFSSRRDWRGTSSCSSLRGSSVFRTVSFVLNAFGIALTGCGNRERLPQRPLPGAF